MPFWQLFYHIVWSTKGREPLLTPEIEPFVHEALHIKAVGLGGVVFAVNGMPDHVHMVVAVPPSIALSTFIGRVKAVASVHTNRSGLSEARFSWQAEYGIFSFDRKRLHSYVDYVERQKEHHAAGTIWPVLERLEGEGVQMIREDSPDYDVGWNGF
jgi:putative transposase